MEVRDWLPYAAIAGAVITVIQFTGGRDDDIRAEAAEKAEMMMALSDVRSDLKEQNAATTSALRAVDESFKQTIEALKGQHWMEDGRSQNRIGKLESQVITLEEEIDTLEKRLLAKDQL